MAQIINDEITQYQNHSLVIPNMNAKADDVVLFVTNPGAVIKRSDANGGHGEISIIENTSYTINLTGSESAKLTSPSHDYSVYVTIGNLAPVLFASGSISVTEASAPSESVQATAEVISNSNNVSLVTANSSLTKAQDYIFADSSAGDLIITLPSAATIPGKKYMVYNSGNNNVKVQLANSTEIITLTGPNRKAELISDGTTWRI